MSLHYSLEVYSLPHHHRDPFDRLLIAQARSEGIPLISGDDQLRSYEVEIVVGSATITHPKESIMNRPSRGLVATLF